MNQGQQEENDTESRITAGMDTGNEITTKSRESRITPGLKHRNQGQQLDKDT